MTFYLKVDKTHCAPKGYEPVTVKVRLKDRKGPY